MALKHAISTKSARVGDSVYAETNFPFVLNEKVIVPAGTYVQGKISQLNERIKELNTRITGNEPTGKVAQQGGFFKK